VKTRDQKHREWQMILKYVLLTLVGRVLQSLQMQTFGTVIIPLYQGGGEYATIR
jgi:hypothetical protein